MFKANDYSISIVETKSYLVEAREVFTNQEQSELANFLAVNPHFGDVMSGTGGVRKVRWKAKGSGKRGGARVIYYFRDLNMPVFLLAVYSKGQKINLSAAEKKTLCNAVDDLVNQYRPQWERIIRLKLQT